MRATITADVLPTESAPKVIEHAKSLFPEAEFNEAHGAITGSSDSVSHFMELAKRQRIRGAVHAALVRNYHEGKSRIELNKQCKGKVNLYLGSELGPITAEFHGSEAELYKAVWGNEGN